MSMEKTKLTTSRLLLYNGKKSPSNNRYQMIKYLNESKDDKRTQISYIKNSSTKLNSSISFKMIVLMVILVWSYPVQSFPTVPRIVSNSIVIRVRRQTPNNSTTIDSKLPNVQSTTTLNPTISTKDLKWPSWMCNYTSYPTDGCSPLVHAYCETQSNTCICRSSSTSTTINTNRPNQKKYCLSPVQLGHQCQSSGQCRSIDPNSACFMMDGIVTDWRCRCIDGNLPMNDGRCDTNSTSTYDNYDRIQYEHCASKGMVWIVGLKRCVNRSTLPFYANRGVGRAGGGRGGGGGGHGRGSVGGRSSGSRAWFSSDRNLMRKNGSINLQPNQYIQMLTLLIIPLLL
ncbi:hypothetical protein BLOT_005101 [Blomia tropicalis]|nr:hypothetical protein BLOT_005101 [Blomia tropicalis]